MFKPKKFNVTVFANEVRQNQMFYICFYTCSASQEFVVMLRQLTLPWREIFKKNEFFLYFPSICFDCRLQSVDGHTVLSRGVNWWSTSVWKNSSQLSLITISRFGSLTLCKQITNFLKFLDKQCTIVFVYSFANLSPLN